MMKSSPALATPIIYLEKLEFIWDYLNGESSIQYFWLKRQPYCPIWELQKQLHSKRVAGETPDIVLFLEHEHVYTFGKNADTDLLLDSKPHDAEVVPIDRGGEVTYHGPGQLVVYPILDLHNYQMSISWYMRSLEGVIIHTLKRLGLSSSRKKDLPGVWIGDEKICAMGVRASRWVTMHGFALNVNADLGYFDHIIPCGIKDKAVTSLNVELGQKEVDMADVQQKLMKHFSQLFEAELI